MSLLSPLCSLVRDKSVSEAFPGDGDLHCISLRNCALSPSPHLDLWQYKPELARRPVGDWTSSAGTINLWIDLLRQETLFLYWVQVATIRNLKPTRHLSWVTPFLGDEDITVIGNGLLTQHPRISPYVGKKLSKISFTFINFSDPQWKGFDSAMMQSLTHK